MEAFGLEDPALRTRLMALYERVDAYPDARDALERIRRGGRATAILSNGTPGMLAAAASHAGLAPLLDAVLSVEESGSTSRTLPSTGWPRRASVSRPDRSCSSRPTGGTPSLPRPSGSRWRGATARVNHPSESPIGRIWRCGRWVRRWSFWRSASGQTWTVIPSWTARGPVRPPTFPQVSRTLTAPSVQLLPDRVSPPPRREALPRPDGRRALPRSVLHPRLARRGPCSE